MKIQDVIDAMEKNGYPFGQGEYIKYDPATKQVLSACIYGQAALNLGVNPADLQSRVEEILFTRNIPARIVYMNDYGDPDLDPASATGNFAPVAYSDVVAYAKMVLSPFAYIEVPSRDGAMDSIDSYFDEYE